MALEFVENITLYMPEVDNQVKELTEAVATDQKKLVIELAAIHEGLTANYNHYPAAALEASLSSWVQPYAKPIILNHDPESQSVGRVMAARMDAEADGTPFIRLQVAITDRDAIERVMDERFLTGSVGGKAESATCSICQTDWAKPRESAGMPCKHGRGKVFGGKLATLELGGLSWKEYSFVNIPADQKSGLRRIHVDGASADTGENDGWIRPVSFYSVDMAKESIIELNESGANKNILDTMKKREAQATYLNVKGTFLSVSALDLKEKSTFIQSVTTMDNELGTETHAHTSDSPEENEMTDETKAGEEQDILAVADQLSADLAAAKTEDAKSDEKAEDEKLDEVKAEDEPTEKSEEADPNAPESNEEAAPSDEETKEEEAKSEEDAAGDKEQLAEDNKDVAPADEPVTPAENADDNKEDDEEKEALKAENDSLKTENAKLKKALHNMFAERVVDAKIAVGLVEFEDRAEALAEHSTRTASSLADSIRDISKLSTLPGRTAKPVDFEMDVRSAVAGKESDKVVTDMSDTEITEAVKTPEEAASERFEKELTEIFLGQRSIARL